MSFRSRAPDYTRSGFSPFFRMRSLACLAVSLGRARAPREVVPGTSALPSEVGVSEFAQQLLQLAAVNVPFHRLGRRLRRWQGVLLGGSSSAS